MMFPFKIGDSGGPLMKMDLTDRDKPFMFVAGIVSFGKDKCGKAGWPSVYTVSKLSRNVQPFRGFCSKLSFYSSTASRQVQWLDFEKYATMKIQAVNVKWIGIGIGIKTAVDAKILSSIIQKIIFSICMIQINILTFNKKKKTLQFFSALNFLWYCMSNFTHCFWRWKRHTLTMKKQLN